MRNYKERSQEVLKGYHDGRPHPIYQQLARALNRVTGLAIGNRLFDGDELKSAPGYILSPEPFDMGDADTQRDMRRMYAIIATAQHTHKHKGMALLLAIYRAAYAWGRHDGRASMGRAYEKMAHELDECHRRQRRGA